jgi:hypothetical protein
VPSEQQIQQHIRIACSTGDTRLFRNNTGTLRDQHGRPVSFGLCKGSADLIGYRTITITPDMVGQQVAVFLSIEVKTPTGQHPPRAAGMAGNSPGSRRHRRRSKECRGCITDYDCTRLTRAAQGVGYAQAGRPGTPTREPWSPILGSTASLF